MYQRAGVWNQCYTMASFSRHGLTKYDDPTPLNSKVIDIQRDFASYGLIITGLGILSILKSLPEYQKVS